MDSVHSSKSFHDVIQYTKGGDGKASTSSITLKKRAVALWDYPGDEDYEQLAFKAGDEIIVIEEDEESGWWWGELNGKEGHFPVNYTKVYVPEVHSAH